VTLRRVGDVGLVGVLYKVCAGPHPDYAAVAVLDEVLTASPSGRLYKELVETKKAASVSGFAPALHDPGMFEIMAEVRKDGHSDDVLKQLLNITEEVGTTGITDRELKRARTQLLKNWELAAADSQRIAIQLSEWGAQGDWRLYFLFRDRVEKVTADDVKQAAQKYFRRSNRTVGQFIPTTTPERVQIPATPEVASLVKDYTGQPPIAAGENFDVSPANIESRASRAALPDGIKTVLLPKKTRGESVQLRLTLRYGNEKDLQAQAAVAEFLPSLLLRGTKKLSYEDFKDDLDAEKAQLSASGDAGTITLRLQTKRSNLKAVLGLVAQALREPAFKPEELEILKETSLTNLEQERNDPQAIAVRTIRRSLNPYAKGDPRYLPTVEEEIEQIRAVTITQVRGLYEKFVNGQNGELSVVGDFDSASLQPLTIALAGWKSSVPYERLARKVHDNLPTGKQVVNTPDKENAVYLAGLVLQMKNDDTDYPALVMGNFVLGGGSLSSRLGDRVRQKDGLSYGVGSSFQAPALDPRASLTIFAITNPENMLKVEAAILDEIQKLLKDGVTTDELARAKKGYLQQLQVGRSNDGQLVGTLGDTAQEGRTMAFYGELQNKIESLTVEQVNAVLRKYVDPKRLFLVTAGDFNRKPQPK
jgi:zinc protease